MSRRAEETRPPSLTIKLELKHLLATIFDELRLSCVSGERSSYASQAFTTNLIDGCGWFLIDGCGWFVIDGSGWFLIVAKQRLPTLRISAQLSIVF